MKNTDIFEMDVPVIL